MLLPVPPPPGVHNAQISEDRTAASAETPLLRAPLKRQGGGSALWLWCAARPAMAERATLTQMERVRAPTWGGALCGAKTHPDPHTTLGAHTWWACSGRS